MVLKIPRRPAKYRPPQTTRRSPAATSSPWTCTILLTGLLAGGLSAQATYVGSDACKLCHEKQWNDHRVSGHPHIQRPPEDVVAWPLSLPEGLAFEDVSYVIGGYRWKTHYLDQDGFLVTDSLTGPGRNQFNVATDEWVDYHAGDKVPYDCGSCHSTGYSPLGHQDGRIGVVGTWALDGVQCERCHGPASDHVALPSSFNITINDHTCDDCHTRDNPSVIAAEDGFVLSYQQQNELGASPHSFLDCVSCHDPHKKAAFSITLECTVCHTDMQDPKDAFKKLGRRHDARGVDCIDCHMPYATKSAIAINPYRADVRSHQFRITLDADAAMFNGDGSAATGVLTPAYACLGCHEEIVGKFSAKGTPEKAETWARKKAKKIHKP